MILIKRIKRILVLIIRSKAHQDPSQVSHLYTILQDKVNTKLSHLVLVYLMQFHHINKFTEELAWVDNLDYWLKENLVPSKVDLLEQQE